MNIQNLIKTIQSRSSDFIQIFSGKKAFGVSGKEGVRLVVCFGAEWVKIGYSRRVGDKVSIEGLDALNISKAGETEMAQFIHGFCMKHHILPQQCSILIYPKQFIFKNVDIPSTEKEEIRKIIDLQAGRFTPYMRDEILIDFASLQTQAQHYTSVLLFIVNRVIVEKQSKVLELAALAPECIKVTSECLADGYLGIMSGEGQKGAVAGLYVGEDYAELIVLDQNNLVFMRALPPVSEAFRKNDVAARKDFFDELGKSINAYHDQGLGQPVNRLILTGLVEKVEISQPEIDGMNILQAKSLTVEKKEYRGAFLVSEGAYQTIQATPHLSFFELFSALKTDEAKINLISPEMKLKHNVRQGSKEMITLGTLIMTLFLLMSLIFGSKIFFRGIYNSKLIKINDVYSEEARRLERVSTKNRVVKKLLDSRGKGLLVLNVISKFISDDIYLSQINYDSS